MRKLLSLAIVAMATMSTWAAAPKVTLNFTDTLQWGALSTSYVLGEHSYTQDGITIKINGTGETKGETTTGGAKYQWDKTNKVGALLIGKKDSYLEFPAFDFDVYSIKVYGVSGGSASVGYNIFAGESAVSTAVTGCKEDHEMVIAEGKRTAGTIYRLKITTAHNIQISKIEIYEFNAAAPAVPVLSEEDGIYNYALDVAITCDTEGAAIKYSTDGVNWNDYTAPIHIAETTDLYAKSVKNELESQVAHANYTIITLEGDGKKDDPYTVEDVIKLSNPGTDAWVIGYILGNAASNGLLNDPSKGYSDATLLLGTNPTDEKGVPVQVPAELQESIGLKTNPELKGRLIKIQGTLVNYYGVPGIKPASDFQLVPTTAIDNANVEVESAKMVENGQLIIIREGKKFNAMGVQLR